MATERGANDCLASPEGQAAFQSLTAIERVMGGRLITRQFMFKRNIRSDISRHGLEGTVKFCSGRAIAVYMLPLGVIVIVFSFSGLGLVIVPAYLLVLLVFALSMARLVSAARSAKRWRNNQSRRAEGKSCDTSP
jgi:hypothetical protein